MCSLTASMLDVGRRGPRREPATDQGRAQSAMTPGGARAMRRSEASTEYTAGFSTPSTE